MTLLQFLISILLGLGAGFGTNALCPSPSVATYAWCAGLVMTAVSLAFFKVRNGRANSGAGTGGGITLDAPSRRKSFGTPPIVNRGGSAQTPARKPEAKQPPVQRARSSSGKLDVKIEQVEGVTKVVVTASGYSGSEWKNRVRPALQKVRTVKWEFPKNLHDGRREMTGTVTGNPDVTVAAIHNIG